MKIKAVFFDFVGTISDARGLALRSLDRTLKDFGHEVSREKILELLGVKMRRMLAQLGVRGKDKDLSEGEVEEIRNRFYGFKIHKCHWW